MGHGHPYTLGGVPNVFGGNLPLRTPEISLRSYPRVTAARSARFERQPAWQAPFDVIHSPWITRNERAARVAPLDFKRSESACFAGRRSPNTSGTPLPCANSPDPRQVAAAISRSGVTNQ